MALGSIGERLPGIDTLAFSSCSTKVAGIGFHESGRAKVYIVDVDSGHAYGLIMAQSVEAVVFYPCGQRLIAVCESSLCIIDSMSCEKLHEVLFTDTGLTIEALSWPEDCNGATVLSSGPDRSEFD